MTRRYHGLLVAALPTPFGRCVMLNYVWEQLRFRDGHTVALPTVIQTADGQEFDCSPHLAAFRLEAGLPVWEFDVDGVRFEKRVLMPYLQNTTHISYRLLSSEAVRLELRPMIGRTVEIFIWEEPERGAAPLDWEAAAAAVRELEDYDYDAWKQQREVDRTRAGDHLP